VITLQMSSRSLQRILHGDLQFHPCRIYVTHELKQQDKAYVNFCRQFLDIMTNDEGVLVVLIVSDKAHFHLPGYVDRISGIGAISVLCCSMRKLSIVTR
jgi:hypothetical protein